MLIFFFKYWNRLALENLHFCLTYVTNIRTCNVHSLSKFTWHGLRSYAFHASVCIAISHKIKRKFEDGEAHFSISMCSMCSQSIVSSFRIAQALSLSHAQKKLTYNSLTHTYTQTHISQTHKHTYTHTHIHTNTQTHIHTNTHTHTHKHTNHKHSYVQHSATKLNNVNC